MERLEAPGPDGAARRSTGSPLLLLAVAVVVVGWVLVAGVSVLSAVRDVDAGQKILRRVHEEKDVVTVLKGSFEGDLRVAQHRLARADHRLDSPLLLPARLLPVAGRQVRSLAALAGAGSHLAGVGADGLAQVSRLLQGPVVAPADRVTLVQEVGKLAARTRGRLDNVSLGPRRGLLPALAEGHNHLAEEYDDVRQGLASASDGAAALSAFLAGPRRYLVFAANNAEMRAGSGMFLSVGTLETSGGRITLGGFQTVFDVTVPPGSVPLAGDMADRWGWLHPNQDWRNLMLSPRFDASASLAAQMWQAVGQPPVDGVVVLDPVTLEQVLKVTGPITVDDRTIDADHVVDELLNAQYRRFPLLEERPERREALGRIAQATFALVDSGAWSLPELAKAVADSAKARHVLVWSSRPGEQAGWHAAGVDGTLQPDSLLVSILNRGGNKLDRYLNVAADLTCAASGGDRDCTLRLDLENVTPVDEPPYIAGPHPGSGVNAGDYLGIVSVDVPGDAVESRIDGVDELAVAGADGVNRVVGFQLVVPRGEKRTVTVRFRLPGRHGAIRVEPSARVPGISWSSGSARWTDGASHTLRW